MLIMAQEIAPGLYFLKLGIGARACAMGEAFTAIADDGSASYWNPAGLTQLDRKEIVALHVNLFADTTYDFLSYVHPTPKLGVFGVNLTRLYSGGFEKIAITFDANKEDIIDIQTLGTFDDVRMAFTSAYGKKIRDNLSVGASFLYKIHSIFLFSLGSTTVGNTLPLIIVESISISNS